MIFIEKKKALDTNHLKHPSDARSRYSTGWVILGGKRILTSVMWGPEPETEIDPSKKKKKKKMVKGRTAKRWLKWITISTVSRDSSVHWTVKEVEKKQGFFRGFWERKEKERESGESCRKRISLSLPLSPFLEEKKKINIQNYFIFIRFCN